MAQNFRKKLYPNYKKRKKKIHPDDKPPEERYKDIRDAEQAVQDADMEEGNYLQDPENNTLAYSIAGDDAAALAINSSTGVLTFQAAPNFEVKNNYKTTVTVSDGTTSVKQNLVITVTDVAE